MRGSIAKKIRKQAFKNLEGTWLEQKAADRCGGINVVRDQGNRILRLTYIREPKAPRAFYRRMKKAWLALTPAQKVGVRFAIPTMPVPVMTPAE
jgi:hypothetical protein